MLHQLPVLDCIIPEMGSFECRAGRHLGWCQLDKHWKYLEIVAGVDLISASCISLSLNPQCMQPVSFFNSVHLLTKLCKQYLSKPVPYKHYDNPDRDGIDYAIRIMLWVFYRVLYWSHAEVWQLAGLNSKGSLLSPSFKVDEM